MSFDEFNDEGLFSKPADENEQDSMAQVPLDEPGQEEITSEEVIEETPLEEDIPEVEVVEEAVVETISEPVSEVVVIEDDIYDEDEIEDAADFETSAAGLIPTPPDTEDIPDEEVVVEEVVQAEETESEPESQPASRPAPRPEAFLEHNANQTSRSYQPNYSPRYDRFTGEPIRSNTPPTPPTDPPNQNARPAPRPVPTPRAESSRPQGLHPFVWGLLAALVVAICAIPIYMALQPATPQTQTIDITSVEDPDLAEAVAAKALPSVVSIIVSTDYSTGAGSGVILDTDGHILTNHHVIENASTISVNMDDMSYSAEVLGADASSDLAVLKVDFGGASVTPIELGDSDNLEVGQWVMAIGSPFGLDRSVSSGIVSSLYRSTILASTSGQNIYANLIQTDAAINPGNSGGALVNSDGQLVGINSIISSYSGSSSGVGFAIPSNYAIEIANEIISGKPVEHAYMGVNVQSVTPQFSEANGIGTQYGAYITSVVEGTPAAACGLKEGDVIVALGDEQVQSADGLILAVRMFDIGETVKVTYYRGMDEKTTDITLGSDLNIDANGGSSTWNEQFPQENFFEDLLGSGLGLVPETEDDTQEETAPDTQNQQGQGNEAGGGEEGTPNGGQRLDLNLDDDGHGNGNGDYYEFEGTPEELQELLQNLLAQ